MKNCLKEARKTYKPNISHMLRARKIICSTTAVHQKLNNVIVKIKISDV